MRFDVRKKREKHKEIPILLKLPATSSSLFYGGEKKCVTEREEGRKNICRLRERRSDKRSVLKHDDKTRQTSSHFHVVIVCKNIQTKNCNFTTPYMGTLKSDNALKNDKGFS